MSPVPCKNENNEPKRTNANGLELDTDAPPTVVAIANSSDDDNDDDNSINGSGPQPEQMGYELLPQDPEPAGEGAAGGLGNGTSVSHRSSGSVATARSMADSCSSDPTTDLLRHFIVNDHPHLPGNAKDFCFDGPSEEALERASIWNQPTPTDVLEPVEPELANKIRSAMADFKLPSSCMPDWARLVPEEQWKSRLLSRLRGQPNTSPPPPPIDNIPLPSQQSPSKDATSPIVTENEQRL